mmetsp:Transcript_25329/g.53570  ORF Transcript_25329/g.53570 Transcript_25329/m.53570 type:complete len:228 (+) Transcript_25329:3101-3784(+)
MPATAHLTPRACLCVPANGPVCAELDSPLPPKRTRRRSLWRARGMRSLAWVPTNHFRGRPLAPLQCRLPRSPFIHKFPFLILGRPMLTDWRHWLRSRAAAGTNLVCRLQGWHALLLLAHVEGLWRRCIHSPHLRHALVLGTVKHVECRIFLFNDTASALIVRAAASFHHLDILRATGAPRFGTACSESPSLSLRGLLGREGSIWRPRATATVAARSGTLGRAASPTS